jgi:hypothetical protein
MYVSSDYVSDCHHGSALQSTLSDLDGRHRAVIAPGQAFAAFFGTTVARCTQHVRHEVMHARSPQ